MSKRLLLWDIDATLVTTAGAGDRALKRAITERWRVEDDLHDIEIAGRTDAHIAASVLRKYGVEPTPSELASFLERYLAHLGDFLPQLQGRVLPGVAELLRLTHGRDDRVLGLLTGNLQRGARLKLERYGLWHYFDFGAFADDDMDRNRLGEFARRRALEKHGHEFEGAFIDVIGDTGHDIACGKAFGARTVAVATGSWTREQLARWEPDFLFDDLSQVETVMKTLGW